MDDLYILLQWQEAGIYTLIQENVNDSKLFVHILSGILIYIRGHMLTQIKSIEPMLCDNNKFKVGLQLHHY